MYFVTVLSMHEPFPDVRTIGFFEHEDNARYAIVNNACDMWEYAYDYAILQKIEEGLYSDVTEETWFKFDMDSKKYHETSKPEKYKTIQFGIG